MAKDKDAGVENKNERGYRVKVRENGGSPSLDEKVRKRVTEILCGAGLSSQTVRSEALYMMPLDFVKAYGALMSRALIVDSGKASGADVGEGGNGGGGKMKGEGGFGVRDEKALLRKREIDGTLRDLAKLMDAGVSKMKGCEFGCEGEMRPGWKFCPKCGGAVGGKTPG